MKTLKQLLDEHPRTPISVSPDSTVLSGLELMAKHGIGAVLVMRDERLVGIFSERDYARKVVLLGKSSRETPMSDIMTTKVFYGRPEQTIDEAMALMTDRHIRHMPVMDADQHVIGVISLGDLVQETMSQQAFLIKQLEQYIAS
ncbi:MAG: CBS domain-containing protein [Sulfuritalea sp.]|jgi:CBS domain-containing protein|nr:CBS domain-containing protein [Sulfuritalea sp.]